MESVTGENCQRFWLSAARYMLNGKKLSGNSVGPNTLAAKVTTTPLILFGHLDGTGKLMKTSHLLTLLHLMWVSPLRLAIVLSAAPSLNASLVIFLAAVC